MEVGGQVHAPADLSPRNIFRYPSSKRRGGGVAMLALTLRREKSFVPSGNQTAFSRINSPLLGHYINWTNQLTQCYRTDYSHNAN